MAEASVCSFPFRGRRFTVDVVADSGDDAEAKVRSLRYATVDGELILREPMIPGPAGMPPLACPARRWWRECGEAPR